MNALSDSRPRVQALRFLLVGAGEHLEADDDISSPFDQSVDDVGLSLVVNRIVVRFAKEYELVVIGLLDETIERTFSSAIQIKTSD